MLLHFTPLRLQILTSEQAVPYVFVHVSFSTNVF